MADTIKITLKIAGRDYPLTIERKDEEVYRLAAKDVNEVVAIFSKSYGLDSENFLAMTALQMSLRHITSMRSMDFGPIIDELKLLDSELDSIPGGKLK